jgi:flagellar hook-basal body complex protein FliE
MRPIHLTAILLLSFGAAALAESESDRQKLLGSWEQEGATQNSPSSSWTFSAANDSIHVTQLEGGNKIADFACGTAGTSCEVKTSGKKATVSMWFNGPLLVEMETKGSEVIKRRFKILPQGDLMEMEVIPIVPGGKTEILQFKRVQLAARQQ